MGDPVKANRREGKVRIVGKKLQSTGMCRGVARCGEKKPHGIESDSRSATIYRKHM